MIKRIVLGSVIVVLSISTVYSQKFEISDSFENEPLEQILKTIEENTGYRFSYSSTSIQTDMRVTVSFNDTTIEDVLDKLFERTSVKYEVIRNRIILKKKIEGQTVRGKVIDSQTQIPIPGAAVVIVDSDPLKGNATNNDGYFRIENVQPGRYTIKASFLGYKDELIPAILVGSGKEVILEIKLEESLLELDEIQVGVSSISTAPLNEMAQVSGRSFTVEETKRFPVGVGDPLRLASSFAGVVSTDDGANDIVVRGNSPKGLLWMLEGVEIPSPNHFSSEGTSSGGISMFSTQVISRSDFLTSAFPSQYGNATAGVFDIQLRSGNNERRESTIQFGLLGLDIASEGPLASRGGASYLFNYRYSTLSMLSAVGLPIEDEGERNIFQDLSFKFNFPTKKAGTFSIFGLGGLSNYRGIYPNIEDDEVYNMGVLGISNRYIINSSTVLRSTLSWSGTKVVDDYVFIGDSVTFRDESTFSKEYIRASFELNKKVNSRHFITSGLTTSFLKYDFQSSLKATQNQPPFNDFKPFNDTGNSGSFQTFTSWKFRPTEKVTMVNGLHLLHFFLSQETVIEPRSNIRWQFHPDVAVFAGFGLHSRIESLDYYFANYINEDGSMVDKNSDLGVTRSSHWVTGFDANITSKTYFKTEFYYQHIFNVPILADSELPGNEHAGAFSTINISDGYVENALVNGGKGWNYGVEVSLERKFSDNYYFLINGMLYESKYQGRDGITRNTRYNGNFGYNFLAGKEFYVGSRKDNILGFNLKLSHAGNKRYTPINIELSRQEGRGVTLAEDIFTERFSDYFRTDIQINYRKNLTGRTIEWRLDVQNVTGHNNVLDIFYDGNLAQPIIPEQKIIIPVLSYRVEF
ncbi:MAG: carboxypeptidase-like regulatory domain-containing protein [Balneolaceae bacterium]|nr:carboxypeptidase-like regulatory domain-containing protein [Balneolaceae bacterium]MBO6545096.1 carboxypeptidase-like regulatory domain-containing protein [Balneolaceae bacterium]MBO6646492.1 carboxypeptidase-like regulatory domain-containing protein [Balneolaceae bacterium]